MVIAIRRIRGEVAVRGVGRATIAGVAAGAGGAAIGLAATLVAPPAGSCRSCSGAVAAVAAVAAFGAVAYALDKERSCGPARPPFLRLARLRP